VNEARFGYDRTTFNFVNVDVNKPGGGYTLNTGVTNPKTGGLPNINFNGVSGFSDSVGTAANRPQYFSPNPYYTISDSISWLRGNHALKFGGEFMHIEAESEVYVNGRGAFNFNGGQLTQPAFLCPPPNPTNASCSTTLEDFFGGSPSAGTLLSGNPALKTTWKHYAAYVQDDWRFSPKVTINLGLRYEYHSPIKEANGLLASFDPAKGLVQQGKGGLDTIWKPYHKDFSPRVGFAWDVTGRGTTVVRGGASVIYSSFVLLTFLGEFGLQNNGSTSPAAIPTAATFVTCPAASITVGTCSVPPTTKTGSGTIGLQAVSFTPVQLNWDPAITGKSGPAFPAASATCGDGIGADPSPCSIMGVDPNLRDPYITNWNLGIQHAFTNNLSLEVSYVGNHGSRLIGYTDINQPPLGAAWCKNSPLTAAQLADQCNKGPIPVSTNVNYQAALEAAPYFAKFPYLQYINWVSNNVHSNFHSLQATLTKRASHGVSFIAGYTFAHGLDNGSLNRFGLLPQDSSKSGAEYGSSDFDIRHRFTLTTTYDIPGVKGYGQLLEGWQINSIVNYQTPQPWYAFDGANNFSGTGENADRWNISGSPDGFRSGVSSIPFCTSATNCTTSTLYGQSKPLSNSGALWAKCLAAAPDASTLGQAGCFVSNTGVLVPPALGKFGNMGRNIFRDSGFKNWDLSVFKNFTFKERYGAQFRVEIFNILNHPNIANPYGASNFFGGGDSLSTGGNFGAGTATPDVAAGNNLIGSGSARVMQLGLKLKF
jgi:hypothetical protein